jgi:hypothetical protein
MFKAKLFSQTITILTVFMLALNGVSPAFAAPSNDNFADATPITSLPFTVNAATSGATEESGEPTACISTFPLKTVWFAYTPSTTIALTAFLNYPEVVGVYTGNSVDSLGVVACAPYYYGQFSFVALANVTYYFQVSDYSGNEGNIPFKLDVTPPPQVQISYYPSDPSIFDNVSFYPYINDPIGCCSHILWTTNDGATSDQYNFYHQFAADGDYTVNVTATSNDGRSGSASQVVHVRTKDVAITTFSIPQTARTNQTKTINVNIQNKRYSDYVQVTLIKGLPGGGEQVIGTLTIFVPAKAKQATTFKFSYTFTSDDAKVGKVTFKAVAYIVNGRDALPSDNTAIATTLVSGSSYP